MDVLCIYLLLKILCLQKPSFEFPITICRKVCASLRHSPSLSCFDWRYQQSYKIEITFRQTINALWCWEFAWIYSEIENFNCFSYLHSMVSCFLTWRIHTRTLMYGKKLMVSMIVSSKWKNKWNMRKGWISFGSSIYILKYMNIRV